jgi:hypothetical protein
LSAVFGPSANLVTKLVLYGAAAGLVALFFGPWLLPRSGYVSEVSMVQPQPVPFSHEHHVGGLGIDCRYCHTSVQQSRFAGLPATHICMSCHSQLWTQAPMLAPVRESLANSQPIHWQRVNTLPDYVYFDHSVHVANGVGCTTCHGPVARMPLMRQAAPLTMGWCLECHCNPAPNLRPREAIFDPYWTPPPDQDVQGKRLLDQYHIRTDHLTDCSVCHR